MITKKLLENYYNKENNAKKINKDNPDPILVARKYNNEYISLICALFSYGNAKLIVKFLESIDFSLLNMSDDIIKKETKHLYYRFQKNEDVLNILLAIKRIKKIDSLENIFLKGYKKDNKIINGIEEIIKLIYKLNNSNTMGFKHLVGKIPDYKTSMGAYKKWCLFLRWMVRNDNVDLGLWSKVDKKDLIIPLDTHINKAGAYFKLNTRKAIDFKSAFNITKSLARFDKNDPVKYDFALYRLFQQTNIS
jgi:uncharacterized protein (TIGR02757 family)